METPDYHHFLNPGIDSFDQSRFEGIEQVERSSMWEHTQQTWGWVKTYETTI
jgi:hypothetical protein